MPSKELTNAAKAIYESRNGARCKPWSQLPQSHQALFLDDAEAARKSFFAALQEPTEVMNAAAYKMMLGPTATQQIWSGLLAASALGEQSE